MSALHPVPRHRPWRSLYRAVPPTIEPATRTALDMFRATSRAAATPCSCTTSISPLTVGDIDAMSDALAVALQQRGVEPGDRIAMYLQNIPQVVVAVLAAWKCGALIVPCNPMLRERELVKILVGLRQPRADLPGGSRTPRSRATTLPADGRAADHHHVAPSTS